MAKTVAQRVEELRQAEAAKKAQERAALKREQDARLRQIAQNELAHEQRRDLQAQADVAGAQSRRDQPITVTLTKGRLKVTIDLTSAESNVRLTAQHAVALAANRLVKWSEALIGEARSRVLGNVTLAATPEEIAGFLSDEIRHAIKHGTARIEVSAGEPVGLMKTRSRSEPPASSSKRNLSANARRTNKTRRA